MYNPHPSQVLNKVFSAKPYQGANPETATFLFVGLDANYAPAIEQTSIFQSLLDYLDDGVAFWRKYGVHHPFLLPGYRGDGRFYHQTFSIIGFGADHAAQVSFIELLHVPTCGRSALVPGDLDHRHLSKLDQVIMQGAAKHIFIPGSVAMLMRATGHFPWLPKTPGSGGGHLKIWFRDNSKTVYWHYHLSAYAQYHDPKMKQMREISALFNSEAGTPTGTILKD